MSAKKLAFNIKSVAIVGAGPSGVAAAKYLLAEKHFDRIEIFEQRNNVGGIWNYTPDDNLAKAEAQAQTIPKTSPDAAVEKPVWRSKMAEYASVDVTRREATFPSALYDDLESNIPKELMQYPDYPFNEQLQLFPGRQEVLKYLEEYAHTVRHLIRFQTQVYDIRQPAQGSWIVRFRDLERGEEMEESYNAVLVASGHYDVSYVPDIEGLREWNEKYPGTVSHSKLYRRPDGYRDKKVIIVGNSASGLDIGGQIAAICRSPLLVSQRSESYLSPGPRPSTVELPEIVRFDVDARSVIFSNGHEEHSIDAVLFCTGYFYGFPFLSSLKPFLIGDGSRVQNLYQHMFWRSDPTLAFLVLNQKVTPFAVAESQAAIVSRVWADRLDLPSEKDMEKWEAAEIAERGSGKRFHVLQYPNDARYIDMLHDWAESAELREGLERDRKGKEAPCWNQRHCWLRERFPAIRKAFRAVGESRNNVKSVEEVGFDFDIFQAENEGGAIPPKSSL